MPQPSVFFLSSVRAYALTYAGESIVGNGGGGLSCTTFGPDPRTSYFASVVQVSLPAAGCGFAADSRSAPATAGRVRSGERSAGGIRCVSEPGAFIGSSGVSWTAPKGEHMHG